MLRACYSIALFLCMILYSCATSKQSFLKKDVYSAERLIGLNFSEENIDTMYSYLQRNLRGYDSLRHYKMPYETFPALVFDHHPRGFEFPKFSDTLLVMADTLTTLPEDINEIAFYTIPQLASLIESKEITSLELTELYLERLEKDGG